MGIKYPKSASKNHLSCNISHKAVPFLVTAGAQSARPNELRARCDRLPDSGPLNSTPSHLPVLGRTQRLRLRRTAPWPWRRVSVRRSGVPLKISAQRSQAGSRPELACVQANLVAHSTRPPPVLHGPPRSIRSRRDPDHRAMPSSKMQWRNASPDPHVSG